MNWNPFKRIAELERELNGLNLSHNRLIQRVDLLGRTDDALADRLNQLEFEVQAQGKWLASLETRLQDLSYSVKIFRAEKAAGDAK